MEKVLFSWSGGKDSALTLYQIQKTRKYQILSLITTVTEDYDRISMHGVRSALLQQQAKSLGLPLEKVLIPRDASNEEYESRMELTLSRFQQAGASSVVFGDIFLEDIRRYRERNLSRVGMKGLFPLWKRKQTNLTRTFLESGFKAIVTCIDSKVLGKAFIGRFIDERFFAELPDSIDPNGENGEFHSFVFDGPIFKKRIPFIIGEVVERDSFYYCDLLPGELR